MKIKVTKRQFKILLDNMDLIGDRGLQLTMSGKTFKKIFPYEIIINEQKLYKVRVWVGGYPTNVLVFSDGGASARMIASKLYPKATVFDAKEIKTKFI